MSDRDLRELERQAAYSGSHKGPWVTIVIRTPEQMAEQERKAREAAPYMATALERAMRSTRIEFAYSPTHEMCEHCGAVRPYFRIHTRWMGNPVMMPSPHHIFTSMVTP